MSVAIVGCDRTPSCPDRLGPELLDAVDTSRAPRPSAVALAEAWAADAKVDPSITPRVASALTAHGESFRFWELLLSVAPAYTEVADALAARGLPVELAALPLALTGYRGGAIGPDCRAGFWLLPPTDPTVRVSECRLRDAPEPWSPPGAPDGGLVLSDGTCRIHDCKVDERADLAASTRAALTAIEARWRSLPVDEDRLITVAGEASGKDPALVLAWHLLATCFYADADAAWSARWKPGPAWCTDVLPMRAREVEACAGQPDAPYTY